MKTLPTSLSGLLARLVQTLRSPQASTRNPALRPAPVLVPIPIPVDRRRFESVQRRRHRGF